MVILAAGLCLLPGGDTAAAEDQSIPSQIGAKFVRGSANIATGWVEIPKQIYLVGKKEGWVQGTFRGPLEGFGMFIARTVAGAYEVLTFPIPLPPRYQPMLLPDYVWQEEPAEQLAVPTDPAAPMITPDNR
jgi:putative exosortase-associated protein (TIGR04073 family)